MKSPMCARGAMSRGERLYNDLFYVPGYRMLGQDVIPMFSGPSADVMKSIAVYGKLSWVISVSITL